MANREFLMLAHTFDPKKHEVKGWYASEKLDGQRCWWDGGLSRGLQKSSVPWANNARDERYKSTPIATGLWTRYGNVIHAPDWFLDELPFGVSLDGELFSERGKWQELSSTIKKIEPNDWAWQQVKFHVFDAPPYSQVLQSGRVVAGVHYEAKFDFPALMEWVKKRHRDLTKKELVNGRFMNVLQATYYLYELCGGDYRVNSDYFDSTRTWQPVYQWQIEDLAHLERSAKRIKDMGGEGVIIRHPQSYWEPKRAHHVLKVKPDLDSEATVIGYVWGRETDKGSKLLGKMGAMIVEWESPVRGKINFELSGFNDAEREMTFIGIPDIDNRILDEAVLCAGKQVSHIAYTNKQFPIGSKVTFKYRELTNDGVPKEARYFRPWTNT
jgi:DNA ligase 1